jgi:hypothetical protein
MRSQGRPSTAPDNLLKKPHNAIKKPVYLPALGIGSVTSYSFDTRLWGVTTVGVGGQKNVVTSLTVEQLKEALHAYRIAAWTVNDASSFAEQVHGDRVFQYTSDDED